MVPKAAAGVLAVVALVVVAAVVAHPLFKRYQMPSESMEPTIAKGDKVNLNRGQAPAVGDVVIFEVPAGYVARACGVRVKRDQPCPKPTPQQGGAELMKRVVAGPGDRVAFRGGRVIRNGTPVSEPYAKACDGVACDLPRAATIPAGMYFMAGDNRGASDDSRFWGPVPRDWILGRVERCHALYFACSPIR